VTENTPLPSPSFAHLLRRFRRAASLTQEQLAERVNLSARAVSDLERDDDRVPRRDTLELLADALRLSPEERAVLDQTVRRAHVEPRLELRLQPAPRRRDDRPSDDLPAQPTSFIGREREVDAVRELVLDTDTRLLTLTGPGGMGKTRLALQVASAVRAVFADGVAFVPLAPLSDPNLVLPAIARALNVGEVAGRALADTLAASLRAKQLLLVLDNFEQILPAAAPIMSLLASAPNVKALVTSRATLRMRGERVYVVPSLAVPTPPLPSLEALSQYEAVRLFIARAHDAQPDFAVTNETAPAVAEVCARLDGLPLAIELAAARTRLLPPDALLARLSNRLKIATGGSHDSPARQQTLRAAIDWSYSLLDPGEQALFARLAVFVGGWTVEAVEAVCNADDALPLDVLDGIESLLDKSLLRRQEGVGGQTRLMMLETIHEYARERLGHTSDAEELRRAHAAYYLDLAETAELELMKPQQEVWLRQLDQEYDNLRAALQRFLERGEGDYALRLASALSRFWEIRAYLSEGRRWLDTTLTTGRTLATTARAKALRGAGVLAAAQGDLPRAAALIDESLTLWQEIGDKAHQAEALVDLAWMRYIGPDPRQATPLFAQGRTLYHELGGKVGQSAALMGLGCLALLAGDNTEGRALQEESLLLAQEGGNHYNIAHALYNLGWAALAQGDETRASACYAESLARFRDLGDKRGVAMGLEGIAALTAPRQPILAARLIGAAAAQRATIGSPQPLPDHVRYERYLAQALSQLGDVAWTAAVEIGQSLLVEQTVAEALAAIAFS